MLPTDFWMGTSKKEALVDLIVIFCVFAFIWWSGYWVFAFAITGLFILLVFVDIIDYCRNKKKPANEG